MLLLLDLVRLEMVCMPHQIIPCLTSECTETAVIRKFINLVCSFIRWSSTLYIWPMKGDSLGHFRHFQNLLLVFILTASNILKKTMQGLKIFPSFVNFFSYRFILTGIVHQALLILKFLLMIYYLSVWNSDTLKHCGKKWGTLPPICEHLVHSFIFVVFFNFSLLTYIFNNTIIKMLCQFFFDIFYSTSFIHLGMMLLLQGISLSSALQLFAVVSCHFYVWNNEKLYYVSSVF